MCQCPLVCIAPGPAPVSNDLRLTCSRLSGSYVLAEWIVDLPCYDSCYVFLELYCGLNVQLVNVSHKSMCSLFIRIHARIHVYINFIFSVVVKCCHFCNSIQVGESFCESGSSFSVHFVHTTILTITLALAVSSYSCSF